jgi:hypothetical protein
VGCAAQRLVACFLDAIDATRRRYLGPQPLFRRAAQGRRVCPRRPYFFPATPSTHFTRRILAKDKEQLKKLWVLTAATTAYVAKWNNDVADYGGDLGGFVVVCGLQTLSIGYLAFA